MSNRWFILAAALLFAAIVGGLAYNVGVHQGVAVSGKIVAPAPGAYPYPYPYPYYGWHPGFFFFPFLFIFFFFFLVRGLFWRARWYGHHHHCGYSEETPRDGMSNVSV